MEAVNSLSVRLSEAEAVFIEGEKFFILEDYSKALLYFSRAAELNLNNPTIFYKLAEVLSKSSKDEDLKRAIVHIERSLNLDNKNKYYYLLASNLYSSLGQFTKAAETLETMIKEVPRTEEYLYELATIYQFDKKDAEVLKVYDRAENILGINEISSLQKQRIYLSQGKVVEAVGEVEKLVRFFPEEERYMLALAELLNQNKQTARAITTIENFLKDNPEAPSSRMVLSGLYRDIGQEKKSKDLLVGLLDDPLTPLSSKLIMVGTYSAEVSQNKVRGDRNKDLEEFVLTLFAKLERAYPTETEVQVLGGDLFLTLELNEKAKDYYLKAVRGGANSFESWQNLLFLETQTNQYDSVIVHSEEALELFPNQAMIYYFNGYAHLRQKSYREATVALEQAKKLASKDINLVAEINSLLGDAYEALKEYDKSAKSYEEALAVNPMNDIVLNNYSYYLSLRKTDLEKAEKMSTQLIKNQPDNATYLDTHAWVLYQRGKYKDAIKVMEKAIATGNGSAIHFEHYGDILFQLGDSNGAVIQWRKAKSMDISNEMIDKKITNRKIY
ncbi:MAG: tetratricopeptide repeat protein [Cyclobacteriaceae bacterium]|nr:tetratricopeptide repeat protein [Cyclobacteriaceae bacterium]